MTPFSRRRFLQLTGAAVGFAAASLAAQVPQAPPAPPTAPTPPAAPEPDWKPLFDGKSLAGWKATDFAGAGEVSVKDGQIIMDQGDPLTGVNGTAEIPKTNYEVSLEAMRVQGSDFFCGLTFPVGAANVTLVVGGWGGGVVGISSINGEDASENETTQYKEFKTGRWYHIRLKVTPEKIEAWLDNDQVVNLTLEDKKLSMRFGEIESSKPFGIASFRTKAALRDLKIRPVGKAAK